jgi:hypothetical protein
MENIHWKVNKSIGNLCGNHMAGLLMAILIERKNSSINLDESGGFSFSSEKIEKSLLITKEMRQKLTKLLISNGFLKIEKKGLPSKHYYYIQYSDI